MNGNGLIAEMEMAIRVNAWLTEAEHRRMVAIAREDRGRAGREPTDGALRRALQGIKVWFSGAPKQKPQCC
jgi:2-methylisocitrate lyase-like PEP mutase family enzyme